MESSQPNPYDAFRVTDDRFPAAEPSLPSLAGNGPKVGTLSNLAQASRMKDIKTAKKVLIAIGIISGITDSVFYAWKSHSVDNEIRNEVRKLGPGFVVDEAKLPQVREEALATYRFGLFLGLGLAVVFVLLGLFVERAPVPLTATGLILFLAVWAIACVGDPTAIVQGIVLRVIFIVLLFKALNAAIAYERAKRDAVPSMV